MTLQQFLNKLLLSVRLQVQKMPRGSKVYGINWIEDAARILHSPYTIIDVGANCGQTTRRLARAFHDAHIYAIEPTPETFEKLRPRVASFPNVEPLRMAIGDKDGKATFIVRDHHESNSFLEISPGTTLAHDRKGTIEVDVETLPTFAEKRHLPGIDILKTNAEGFDYRILAGAKPLLEKQAIKLILTEVMFADVFQGQSSLAEFLLLMQPFGYRFVGLYETAVDHDGGMLHANAMFIANQL